MKTINPKQLKNPERKWYIVDAEEKTLGRLATKIATILRGKNKIDFAPHVDNGDYVIVLNSGKIKITGSKESDKIYISHSGHLGNMKTVNVATLRAKKPIEILRFAVTGMLPKNRLRDAMLARLKLELGNTHKYDAQKPIIIE